MKHKYLRELFPNGDLPFPYCEKDYHDFDERDTFCMDNVLVAWIYERLRYFQDGNTCIDLNYHKFNINGEELSQIQCIDRMVQDCATILQGDSWKDEEFERMDAAKDDLFKVFSKVYWAMWW